jgi:hydrogenase maturation factor
VEICEYFDVNPYQLKGDGALLFLTHDSAAAMKALKAHGISAAVIGRVNESNDRVLINEEETRFLEPNRVDEYEKARKFERK